ncbi:MAG: PEGA domain-containing protein [Deltaproteobacteria bacterium]|nr:PEGA domain-containing protein [Deltaproteobacteria bacterium]
MKRILAAFVSLAIAGGAAAETGGAGSRQRRAAARTLVDEGNALLRDGKHEAALARYQSAYDLYPSPKLFFNLAEVHREMGDMVRALEYYERFLLQAGVTKGSELFRQASKQAHALERRIATLGFSSSVPGVEVFVDGRSVGTLPRDPVRVPPGVHDIAAERQGYELFRASITAEPGTAVEVELRLRPKVEPAPTPAAAPAPSSPVAQPAAPTPPPAVSFGEPAVPLAEPRPSDPSDHESGGLTRRWWFWAGTAAILAGAVVGVGAAVASGGEPFRPGGELGLSSTADWRRL